MSDGTVTLKDLAKEARVTPKMARRRLRESRVGSQKESRWVWPRRERRQILRIIINGTS